MTFKIFTECGNDIGYGHISRCTALYDEIVEQGHEAKLYVAGDVSGCSLLLHRSIVSEEWTELKFLISQIEAEDYCIIDSYIADEVIYQHISRLAKKVLYIDDTNRIEYPEGIVLNPALDLGDINYPIKSNNSYLWGCDYIILRNEFASVIRRKIRQVVKRVLVVIGGTDVRNIIPKIIKKICKSYPEITFDIVRGYVSEKDLDVNEKNMKNVVFHENISAYKMRELMKNTDFAITAAGQTIYELLATQTPFITVMIAENQMNNVNSLCKLQLTDSVLDCAAVGFLDALNVEVVKMLDWEVRKKKTEKYKDIIDGRGCNRIIQKMMKEIATNIDFRSAEVSDCDLLYKWANDQDVRKNAFTTEKIEYDKHKIWYSEKLESLNVLMYVIVFRGVDVGQIRIDIENNRGIISYSVDSEYRGKGIGSLALRKIWSAIETKNVNVKELIGLVKIENVPSQKAFEYAGYSKRRANDYFEYTRRRT